MPSSPEPAKTLFRPMTKEQPNRDERIKKLNLKEDVAARHRGAGAGVNVLRRVVKQHPNDPKKQMAAFLRDFVIKSGTGRLRPVSQPTSDKYTETLMMVIDELREERANVNNLSEIGRKHALRLIGRWIRQGQSASTIQNKTSILRRFLTFVGKENLIPRGHLLNDWLTSNGLEMPTRTIVARSSKSWDENDVDVFEVLKLVAEACLFTAIQLEMQVAFGLRMKESIQLIPRVADHGTYLSVVWGTKGGLPRNVNFDEDATTATWQRDVLERAKLMADQNRKGTLSIQGKSLAQSKDHFYYFVRKFGISRKGLGVTAHGLRHQFSARRYQELTGFGAPVTAHAPAHTAIVAEADLMARTKLSRELGHFRPDVTQAYTGSFHLRDRGSNKRINGWIDQTEGNESFKQVMAESSIARAWLGGSFASGLLVGPHEKLRLFLSPRSGVILDADARFFLKNALNVLYPRGVDFTLHYEEADPDECVELFLPAAGQPPYTQQQDAA